MRLCRHRNPCGDLEDDFEVDFVSDWQASDAVPENLEATSSPPLRKGVEIPFGQAMSTPPEHQSGQVVVRGLTALRGALLDVHILSNHLGLHLEGVFDWISFFGALSLALLGYPVGTGSDPDCFAMADSISHRLGTS